MVLSHNICYQKQEEFLSSVGCWCNVFFQKHLLLLNLYFIVSPARKVSLETTKKCLQNQLRFNTKISILLFQNNLLIMKHQRNSKRDGDILMLQHFFEFSNFLLFFDVFLSFSLNWCFQTDFLLLLSVIWIFCQQINAFRINQKISKNYFFVV